MQSYNICIDYLAATKQTNQHKNSCKYSGFRKHSLDLFKRTHQETGAASEVMK